MGSQLLPTDLWSHPLGHPQKSVSLSKTIDNDTGDVVGDAEGTGLTTGATLHTVTEVSQWVEINYTNGVYRLKERGFIYDQDGNKQLTDSGKSYRRWSKHIHTFISREAAELYRQAMADDD